MNAALLLSAILIMAPVTALINTITSHWKSLTKTLLGCCIPGPVYNTGSKLCRGLCWLHGGPLCCDFLVHHCPCLMEAWLFLSSCCDSAKCPFYEHEGCSPHCQHTHTHTNPNPQHTQTVCPHWTV